MTYQKIPILGHAELSVGDKFSFGHWKEPDGYYQVIDINEVRIALKHNLGLTTNWQIRDNGSFFSDYRPYKIIDFIPYDPNQMVSDEDDL